MSFVQNHIQYLSGNAMAEINIKMRLGTDLLYNTKIHIDLEQTIIELKNCLCEKDETLDINGLIAVYCGENMLNERTLSSYELFDGATVHVFKDMEEIKVDLKKNITLFNSEINFDKSSLQTIFNKFLKHPSYKAKIMKLVEKENLNNIIIETPELNHDLAALTLLKHFDELVETSDSDTIDRIIKYHPALASAMCKIASTIIDEDSQVHFIKKILVSTVIYIIIEFFYLYVTGSNCKHEWISY